MILNLMQFLPVAKWRVAFEQITKRYAAADVIMRQTEFGRKQPQLLLWRTPLRRIRLDIVPPNKGVTIVAGQHPPFIEVPLGPIVQIRLQLAPDQALDFLRFYASDGTISQLIFKH